MRGTKGRITEIDTYNNIQCERELQEVHNIQEREKKENWTSKMSLPSKFKKSDISISGLVHGWQMCACQVPRGTGGVNVRHGTLPMPVAQRYEYKNVFIALNWNGNICDGRMN